MMEALIQLTRKNTGSEAAVTYPTSLSSSNNLISFREVESQDNIAKLLNRGKEILINFKGTVKGPSLNLNAGSESKSFSIKPEDPKKKPKPRVVTRRTSKSSG